MVELGVFLPVLNNGYIISTAAPQYQPSYAMNKAMTLLAEDLGFRFVLSPVKYRGYGGPTEQWDYALESFEVMAALAEATDVINKDKMAAAQLWIEDSHSKLSPDFVHNVLAGPQVKWTLVPENTMKYADFMHKVGTIKEAPASWKDLFFPEIGDKAGS